LIINLCDQEDDPMPQFTAMPTAATCQAWCAESQPGAARPDHRDDPADHLCSRTLASPAYGELLMTHSADQSTVIALYNVRDELTPDQAWQLALDLLAQVATASLPESPGPLHRSTGH
jgi:hypothetical protein